MSSKSAVKLVAPADAPDALFRWVAVLTGSKNALKGVGFFLGGLLLTVAGFRTALVVLVALVAHGPRRRARADARGARPPRPQRALRADVLEQPRRQRPGRGAGVPVRLARRVVRRRAARLPAQRAGLELLAGRSVPRALGDRLRHRAGAHARHRATARRRHGRAPRRAHRRGARVRPGGVPGRHRARAPRRPRPHLRRRRRPCRVRRDLRPQLDRALVPHPCLRRQGEGRDERRLLLHGECRRAPRRHRALGPALPVAGTRGCACGRRRPSSSSAGLLSLLLPRRVAAGG